MSTMGWKREHDYSIFLGKFNCLIAICDVRLSNNYNTEDSVDGLTSNSDNKCVVQKCVFKPIKAYHEDYLLCKVTQTLAYIKIRDDMDRN